MAASICTRSMMRLPRRVTALAVEELPIIRSSCDRKCARLLTPETPSRCSWLRIESSWLAWFSNSVFTRRTIEFMPAASALSSRVAGSAISKKRACSTPRAWPTIACSTTRQPRTKTKAPASAAAPMASSVTKKRSMPSHRAL